MDEQFDNKLTNRIREVFDDYEHPGAEHGWEQLRKKFPAERKSNKVAWLWWASAAAMIIVFLGIGMWYNIQNNGVNNLAVKPVVKQQPVTNEPKPADNNQPNNITPSTDPPVVAKNSAPVFINPGTPAVHYKTPVVNTVTAPVNTDANTGTQTQQVITNSATPTFAQVKPSVQASVLPPVTDSQKLANNIASQPQMAVTTQAPNGQVQANNNVAANNITKKQPKTMADMFANEKLNQPVKRNNTDKQGSKKVNFSVYAATYFNYAEGSANQINAGAGFTSDFRLTKNLKLSTGVALAQNSLSYNATPPQSPSASGLVASAPALKQQDALFATSAVFPVFKNYNASLVGLDIPINIKYEFNPEKSDAYISAGVSSGTFIDESYTYLYTYSNGTSTNAKPAEQQTTHNSFNNFYFGKTLNFSFGVGYPVGGNRLIVEPFVKYPLGGLGAQDIRFGAGGINLKFSFKTQKK